MELLYNMFYTAFIHENRYLLLLDGLWTTLLITFLSFLCGTLLGALFAAALCSRTRWLKRIATIITQLFVQLPTLVLLMLVCYVFFAELPIAIIWLVIFGLTLKTASYMAGIFASALSAVSEGEAEAARALGMTKFQTFFSITLPQTVRIALPLYQNQFVATLQETSIVGHLAVQDLTRANDIIASRTLNPFLTLFVISIAYLSIGWIATALLNLLGRERHLGEESI